MRNTHNEYDSDDIHEIVNSLIDGMALARVPEELHPQLLMPLSAAKNEAIVAGNQATVKRLQSIMRQLHLNPDKKRNRTGSRLSARSERSIGSSRPQSAFTTKSIQDRDQEVDKIIDELMEGRAFDSVESSIIPRLITALKDRKEMYLASGDYHTSQQLENLIQESNRRKYEATYQDVQNGKITNLRLQLLQAKADLEAAEQFWKEAKERQLSDYNDNLSLLEEQHQQQLDDYDNSFPEVLPANYRKLSSHVLQIREQEKHLVLSKRYEDAIPFRERADALEAEELEQQREKFIRAFNIQREQLIESHNSQRSCFDRNWERKWERFNKEKNNEISVLKRTIANFERRIGLIENEAENNVHTKTFTPSGTPRNYGYSTRNSALSSARTQNTSRSNAGPSAAANVRMRNIAASRMTQKKPVIRRVPSSRETMY